MSIRVSGGYAKPPDVDRYYMQRAIELAAKSAIEECANELHPSLKKRDQRERRLADRPLYSFTMKGVDACD